MRVQVAAVEDSQRKLVVAADRLKPELTLLGSASAGQRRGIGSALTPSSNQLDFREGIFQGIVTLDLPFERTAEAIDYRNSFIDLEQQVRAMQELEDQIKLQVRNKLRDMLQARSSLKIQVQSTRLAERQVRGTALELEAGRAQIRDLLDAQEALVSAQNALTAAMVGYRVAELEMQRDLGLLQVDEKGMWHEIQPMEADNGNE
jgi:outer membrane protein TolC